MGFVAGTGHFRDLQHYILVARVYGVSVKSAEKLLGGVLTYYRTIERGSVTAAPQRPKVMMTNHQG